MWQVFRGGYIIRSRFKVRQLAAPPYGMFTPTRVSHFGDTFHA